MDQKGCSSVGSVLPRSRGYYMTLEKEKEEQKEEEGEEEE